MPFSLDQFSLNKISKELGISDESMTSLMKQFESYKWIIKLNTQVTPTIVDFGKYAIELFTGKKMFNEANQESKKIMFKLRFGMRMESDCKVAKLS